MDTVHRQPVNPLPCSSPDDALLPATSLPGKDPITHGRCVSFENTDDFSFKGPRSIEEEFVSSSDPFGGNVERSSSVTSLSELMSQLQSGSVSPNISDAGELPEGLAVLLDNPLMVELMSLFINTVQEKSDLVKSCEGMRRDISQMQVKYAESLETIQVGVLEAEQERDQSSKIAQQVKKQLLQTKEDMEANLEAKEEELSRMSASYSKLQSDFAELTRRLRTEQVDHEEEQRSTNHNIEVQQSVIVQLQNKRALSRKKSENLLTNALSNMVKEKEEEVLDLKEEIIILRKEIADSDDIKDGSDDVTVVHEDRKEVHAVEVPSAKWTASRSNSRLSDYFPTLGARRSTGTADLEVFLPSDTTNANCHGGKDGNQQPAEDEDEECDLGQLKIIMDEQIAKSKQKQLKMRKRHSIAVGIGTTSGGDGGGGANWAAARKLLLKSAEPIQSDIFATELLTTSPGHDSPAGTVRRSSHDSPLMSPSSLHRGPLPRAGGNTFTRCLATTSSQCSDDVDGPASLPDIRVQLSSSSPHATGDIAQWTGNAACAPSSSEEGGSSSQIESGGGLTQETRMEGDGSESDRPPVTPNSPSIRFFSVVILGNSGAGKTCFCHRLSHNQFSEKLSPTVGVDFVLREFTVDEEKVTLKVWDTAGTERFRSIAPTTIRKADGVIIMYDVTCESSFNSVGQWIGDVQAVASEDCPILIVGNKVDLSADADSSGVPVKQAERSLEHFSHIGLILISCKTGDNVDDVYTRLARNMIKQENAEVLAARQGVPQEKKLQLAIEETNNKKCSC